jgi:hypothetical protein
MFASGTFLHVILIFRQQFGWTGVNQLHCTPIYKQ